MAKFDVDSDLVHKLAALLKETGLGEIEYEAEGRRVRVALPASPVREAAAPAAREAIEAESAPDTAHPGAVLSPMVGTIYLSPAPGEPPFVRAGDQVDDGQTLMLIEAMKTFNEINSHRRGAVTRILVADGQPVEYGEVLAIID